MSVKNPTIHGTPSVWIAEPNHEAPKIDAYVYVNATWRGEPVAATFHGTRYTTADGTLQPWRVYVERADLGGHFTTSDTGNTLRPENRSDATDTARARIGDACSDMVDEVLESDAYHDAHARAVVRMIARELQGDTRRRGTRPARSMMARYANTVARVPNAGRALVDAVDAIDTANALVQAVDGHANS